MKGKARTLYYQRAGHLGAAVQKDRSVLQRLVDLGRLQAIDLAFAQSLGPVIEGEALTAALCHLFYSSRQGHLCVRVSEQGLHPAPEATWLAAAEDLSAEELKSYRHMVEQGFALLPGSLAGGQDPLFGQTVIQDGERFYLQRYWLAETTVLRELKRLLDVKPVVSICPERVETALQKKLDSNELLPKQAESIRRAALGAVTMITGGPGTGKTYTAGHLIRLLAQVALEDHGRPLSLALAAPTGKAAANLASSLKLETLADQIDCPAPTTLHSLLGIRPRGGQKDCHLDADLILVDESSMIEVELMARLLKAVRRGSRIVFLGDKDQLPPVEGGGVFADFTMGESPVLSERVVQLRKCLRIESQDLLDFANKVNSGCIQEALACLSADPSSNIHLQTWGDSVGKEEGQRIAELVTKRYRTLVSGQSSPEEIFQVLQQFRLLSPLRQGPLGVDELNQAVLERFLPSLSSHENRVLPIMIVSNDYRTELFNGEMGVLVTKAGRDALLDRNFDAGDYALFPARSGSERMRRIPALLLPKCEYAFCLSVHKSQGSEFQEVLLVLPPSSEVFGKEVLYTAVTRARRRLQLYASQETLLKTLSHSLNRVSGVLDRMVAPPPCPQTSSYSA